MLMICNNYIVQTNTMEILDIQTKKHREWVNARIIENTLNLINDVDSYYKNIFTYKPAL